MKVDVQVRGIEELKRELARLSDAVATRLAKNAVMAAARVAARHARELAPVETGQLRASIKARRDPNRTRGRVQALAGTKLFYPQSAGRASRIELPRSTPGTILSRR
jgi:hypothetical protein